MKHLTFGFDLEAQCFNPFARQPGNTMGFFMVAAGHSGATAAKVVTRSSTVPGALTLVPGSGPGGGRASGSRRLGVSFGDLSLAALFALFLGLAVTQREMLHTAFDLCIAHFDLANNQGPPYGSAKTNFGEPMRREEMLITSKTGWDMWPGSHGQGKVSRNCLLANLDQRVKPLVLECVDTFCSHHFDGDAPLEETCSAVHHGQCSVRWDLKPFCWQNS